MGGLVRASYRISSFSCESYSRRLSSSSSRHKLTPYSAHFSPFHSAISPQKSPMDNNILRILRTRIDYLSQYSPLHQPVTKFKAFTVEARPGEPFFTRRSRFAEDEHIKIEATMFDGLAFGPKCDGQDVQLHISLLVDICKGEGHEVLEFLCSAWPDALEIQNVYIFKPGDLANKIYMGPNVRDQKVKLRNELYEFLNRRGVTDQLATFLHQYMMNKDRIELIHWLGKVELFVVK